MWSVSFATCTRDWQALCQDTTATMRNWKYVFKVSLRWITIIEFPSLIPLTGSPHTYSRTLTIIFKIGKLNYLACQMVTGFILVS